MQSNQAQNRSWDSNTDENDHLAITINRPESDLLEANLPEEHLIHKQ